jgi:putative sigma-54 modulation protein
MELQISSKHLELTADIRSLVEQKIGKIARYVTSAKEAKVELSFEKTRSPEKRYRAQVTVTVKGVILRAEETAENIRAAIDKVAETIIEQSKRYKDKRFSKGREGSAVRQTASVPAIGLKTADEDAASYPDIVRVKRFPVKPMAVNEAVEQMELLAHDFFLFVNSETSRFCCLYHRKDGKFGLIETEST